MKVSIVIPNWNGEELLRRNLPAVLEVGAGEVIIVDDSSNDESVDYIKNEISKIKITDKKLKIIENKKNLGFAVSVNRGVKAAHGDIVILLNTDVQPLPGLLKAALPHFKDPKVFGVSFSEEKFSWARGLWRNGFIEHEPGPRTEDVHPTFWVSGGSGAFRKSIWEELGGFDLLYYPFYWEDIDLSYRAAKRGYKLLWVPKARVLHNHEGTIGKYFSRDYINFIQQRNQLIFIWKNITSQKMFKEHLMELGKRFVKSLGYLRVILAAVNKFLEVKKRRAKEIKEAKITDEEVFRRFD